jgi:hypothetical protein
VRSEIDACFTLQGNAMDPDEVTRMLGIAPTKIRMPPGSGRYAHRSYRTGFWKVRSKLPKDREMSHQVRDLLDDLDPIADKIAAVRARYGLEAMIDVIVESYDGDTPSLFLEPDLVKRMGDLGVAFWIDLYLFDGKDVGASESEAAPWD